MLKKLDPYFAPEYAEASEGIERGKADLFIFDGPEGRVEHSFILRPVPISVSGLKLYDIISPYGYGGPRLLVGNASNYTALASAFEDAFADYCRQRRVVSEFVRFHPFEASPQHVAAMYEVRRLRTTVVTDLRGTAVFEREFSKGARKKIRRNERFGMHASIAVAPTDLGELKRVYALSMQRNTAADFYYFTDIYFDRLMSGVGENLMLAQVHYQDKVIAAALCLIGTGNIHIHLSGTDTEYLSLSPAYTLRHAIAQWGLSNGFTRIHHGGGRTNDPEDSLYRYKRQFGSGSADYYVGRRIWDRGYYEALCRASGASMTSEFFPAYRERSSPDE